MKKPQRPPLTGSLGPPQSALPAMSLQYRPAVPPQQPQPHISVAQQFQPVGHSNIGMPPAPPPPQIQYPLVMVQLPPRPPAAGADGAPQGHAIPLPEFRTNGSVVPVQALPRQPMPISQIYVPGYGGPVGPLTSLYNLSSSSDGLHQTSVDSSSHYQQLSQTTGSIFTGEGQSRLAGGNQGLNPDMSTQQHGEPRPTATNVDTTSKSIPADTVPSIWIEHTARNGKRYYYNRRTTFSTWEKPVELMTAIERADASTDWREFTTPDGRKYYYNKVTKQSKWRIPDELKLAREGLNVDAAKREETVNIPRNLSSDGVAAASTGEVNASSPNSHLSSFTTLAAMASPTGVAAVEKTAVPSLSPAGGSPASKEGVEFKASLENDAPIISSPENTDSVISSTTNAIANSGEIAPAKDASTSGADISPGSTEEPKKEPLDADNDEDKKVDQQTLIFETKLEAKNAFKALLDSAGVGSDWTWDQAMRGIVTDRRYDALKTLGERKQAFNEYQAQKKKQEAEDRRARQKKAKEDFREMLEESSELTSSARWSKVISLFEDDKRFEAVERAKDREDIFEDYMKELEKKERAKALEEHKRHRMEYLEFLKSCDFIVASSQWRKVQDRLEADERCSRLEKIDCLEIFQEYIRELEKEEEEQRKLKMEEQRKAERKNRDEFRKLMEEHIAAGTLTAKTHWRDYCMMVKDSPAYTAVSSNTSGSTAKDLFEDVAEELEKQYLENKAQIRDAVKIGEITLTSAWTFEDFKSAVTTHISPPPISDANLKLVFEELLERAQEKEEKEAKRLKRLADDLYGYLQALKEITPSSRWEDFKRLVEERFVAEESFFQEIFDKVIRELREKAKEKERKRKEEKERKDKERKSRDKRKEKHRRDKEKGDEDRKRKERTRSDGTVSFAIEDDTRFGRDKDKHRKHRSSSLEETGFDETHKDRWNSQSHSDERKKSKRADQRERSYEPDPQIQYKRQRRGYRNDSHRDSEYDVHKNWGAGEV